MHGTDRVSPAAGHVGSVADAVRLLDDVPTDTVDGLAVTRAGRSPDEAPTLVLVHGVGAARSTWAPVLPALAEDHHLVVPDLPGHGRSRPLFPGERADCGALARLLAHACVELGAIRPDGLPHLVGSSLGGWVGLELAADGAVASLTALAPAGLRPRPLPPGPLLRSNRTLARRTRPLAGPLLGLRGVRRLTLASVSARPERVPAELARSAVACLAACTGYERMLDAARRRRFERGRQVGVPTTIVFGDRDLILPGGAQRPDLAPPHAEWVRLTGCGHTPMWDAPEETVRLVRRTVDAARGG